MASAYPAVVKPPGSRIPSLRTSRHFRRHSSQLELIKQNFQRKVFIEREEKMRAVVSANAATREQDRTKRYSLPSSLPGSRAQLARGDNGPRGFREESRQRRVEPEVLNQTAPLPPQYQSTPKKKNAKQNLTTTTPSQQPLTPARTNSLNSNNRPVLPPVGARQPSGVKSTPNKRYSSRPPTGEQQQQHQEQRHNQEQQHNQQQQQNQERQNQEQRQNQEHVSNNNDFEADPPFAEHPIEQKKASGMSPIDWNVCTEIIQSRTPTPLNIADEGDSHVFRRGSGVSEFNKTPVIPPISSNSNTPNKTPSNGHSNAATPSNGHSNAHTPNNGYSNTAPPSNGYSNTATKAPSRSTPAKTPSNKPATNGERKRKPQPVEKQHSVEETQESNEQDPIPVDEKARLREMIRKKEESLRRKIAEEEMRLERMQEEEDQERKMQQRKRLEEQKRKRLEETQKKMFQKQMDKSAKKRASGQPNKQLPTRETSPPEVVPPPAPDIFSQPIEGEDEAMAVRLIPCGICGRKFGEDRLAKHTNICNKTATKQRKVFDTTKKRAEGTDYAQYVARGMHKVEHNKPKTRGWKNAHDEFQQIVKCARTGVAAPPVENPDYITCPTCNRRFNEGAGKRHMPVCKERNSRKPMKVSRRK